MKNTCLIGPPAWIGVPAGGALGRFAGLSCLSAAFVSDRSFLALGSFPMPTSPLVMWGRDWRLFEPVWFSVSEWNGSGPLGFGPTPRPLAVSQTSVAFLEMRTSVG